MKSYFQATLLFAVLFGNSALSKAEPLAGYTPPLELYCTVYTTGKSLNCAYVEGAVRKTLNDQGLIDFINRANKGAFVTVRSKKGRERVFFLDPNGVEFRNFYKIQSSPATSMRELGLAKYSVFAAVENKVIQISNNLDTASPTELVSSDPANAYALFKGQIAILKKDNEELEKYRTSATEKNLEATLEEKRTVSHYLSLLVKTMGESGSCAEEFQLKPNADGSIDLEHLNELAKLFQQNCHKDSVTLLPETLALHKKYSKAKIKERSGLVCAKTYEIGPAVISQASGNPLCYGIVSCGKEKDKTDKWAVTCAATISDGHYVCPAADQCAQMKDIFIFDKDIRVDAPTP